MKRLIEWAWAFAFVAGLLAFMRLARVLGL